MNNNENKSVLKATDNVKYLKKEFSPISHNDLQNDYEYFKAQEVAKLMLNSGLISLSEFNKLTLLNRKTFSPFYVEIMSKIT